MAPAVHINQQLRVIITASSPLSTYFPSTKKAESLLSSQGEGHQTLLRYLMLPLAVLRWKAEHAELTRLYPQKQNVP